MLQWHQLEIDRLHSRPHHPVLLQSRPICTLQLLFRIGALHVRHAAEEEEQIRRGEDSLVDQNPGGNRRIGAFEVDVLLEESVPQSRAGAKDRFGKGFSMAVLSHNPSVCEVTSAIECHSPRPGQVLVLKPNSLDGLLAHDIPSRKEDLCEPASAIELGADATETGIYSRGDGLCQDGPLRKLQLVPVTRHAISAWGSRSRALRE